jgi:DNA repair exonuclease SbcCD ATPase subunit
MRNRIFLLGCTLVLMTGVRSQAYESRIEYQKTQQSAAVISLPCSQDVAAEGLKEYMAKKGAKGAGFKDFTVYRSFMLDSNDKDLSDLYFKIDRKSSKEKEVTLITLVPARKGEEIQTRSATDQAQMDEAKAFLNQLAPYIESHHVNVEISEQQQILTKAQKKMSDLMDDSTDLEKKIRKLQADLNENKNDQTKQTKEVEATVNSDFATHQKAQKKLNHLIDDKGDLDKKLRKTQAELDQNKKDQEVQRQIIQNEQQVLTAIKAKQKPT